MEASEAYKDTYAYTLPETREKNYEKNLEKIGDAVYEISSQGTGSTSWYGSYSQMPYSSYSVFVRGGSQREGVNAGIFAFDGFSGGRNGSEISFRPTLRVYN